MGKIIRMTLEEALARPMSERQKAEIEKLRNIRDEDIDFSDNPEATDEDYATGRVRVVGRGGVRLGAGRKPSGNQSVQLRLRPATIRRLHAVAKKRKVTLSQIVEERLVGV